MSGFVPPKTYKIITKLTPVVTNDILIQYQGKFLLLKRTNEPCKGLWWTPGGRLYKNERIIDAVHRVVKEELGIRKIKIKKFLGVFEFFLSPGKFGQKVYHPVSFGFFVEPVGSFKIKLDSQHSQYKFFAKIPQNSHPFIKKLVQLTEAKNYRVIPPYTYKITGR